MTYLNALIFVCIFMLFSLIMLFIFTDIVKKKTHVKVLQKKIENRAINDKRNVIKVTSGGNHVWVETSHGRVRKPKGTL